MMKSVKKKLDFLFIKSEFHVDWIANAVTNQLTVPQLWFFVRWGVKINYKEQIRQVEEVLRG